MWRRDACSAVFYQSRESSGDGQEFINLGSNNYLDLTTDPRIIETAQLAVAEWGIVITDSRVVGIKIDLPPVSFF